MYSSNEGRRRDARTDFRSERSAGYTGDEGKVPCSIRSHDLFGDGVGDVRSDRFFNMLACCFLYGRVVSRFLVSRYITDRYREIITGMNIFGS